MLVGSYEEKDEIFFGEPLWHYNQVNQPKSVNCSPALWTPE